MKGPTLPQALGEYAGRNPARFHMPGHKGRGVEALMRGGFAGWDVTELSFSDNLHRPTGAIARAQESMAKAYDAAASFYVVNGSTGAVQAMILSLGPGEKLLLSRDAHRSAAAGVALSGIPVEYILPAYDAETGLWGMVTPTALEEALTRTGATAVLITSPNFYGCCADIAGLSRVCRRHDALLLVDGAHGAHFPFSPALPTPLAGYADLWAHSQHKTMDAFTQAASLHMGRCRVQPATVQRILAMIETSSPSYLLMASLDWSVFVAERRDWTGQVERMNRLRKRLDTINGISLLPDMRGAGVRERDATRLVLDVTARGITGFAAAEALEKQEIYVEMADRGHIVCITTPSDDPAWYERLYEGLMTLPYGIPLSPAAKSGKVYERLPERCLSPREAMFSALAELPLAEAVGRIAGEPMGVYPPGIALTMPGERISTETVSYLMEEQQTGGTLFGVRNGLVSVVEQV